MLENAVPLDAIEPVHGAYMDSYALGKPLKSPPLSMPFVDHSLIANPLVVQVMRAAMGDKIAWGLYYIHAVPPRSGHEAPPHKDGNPIFPELPFALPISGLSVDIPLDDFTEENGATRLWLGSMPNGTDETRAMISLGYTCVFPHAHERLPLPTEHKRHWPQETRSVLKTGFVNKKCHTHGKRIIL